MNRDQLLKFNRVIKELQDVVSNLSAMTGGPSGLALETKQDDTITVLGDINTSLLAQKDGEFRMYTDPNDNDRIVGVSIDASDPSNPSYVYKYMDDNSFYIGSVNDLEQLTNSTQASIELLLTSIDTAISAINTSRSARDRTYYLIFDGVLDAAPDISNVVEIYWDEVDANGNITPQTWDDGGNLAVGYANLAAMVAALNAEQPHFEFFVLSDTEMSRVNEEESFTNLGVLGIRPNTANTKKPNQVILETSSTALLEDVYYLDTLISDVDVISVSLKEVEKGVILNLGSALGNISTQLSQINDKFIRNAKGVRVDLTNSDDDPWGGFPMTITNLSFDISGERATDGADFNINDARTVEDLNDLISLINECTDVVIAERWSDSTETDILFRDGTRLASRLSEFLINSSVPSLSLAYSTFTDVVNNYDSILDYIFNELARIRNSLESVTFQNWEYQINRVVEFEYYGGVAGGNPSGNTNNLQFKTFSRTGSGVILKQEFQYDANDRIIRIQTSND